MCALDARGVRDFMSLRVFSEDGESFCVDALCGATKNLPDVSVTDGGWGGL